MASIANDRDGTRRLLFTGLDGERKTIRLGRMASKRAETFRLKIEAIIEARWSGTALDSDTAAWLGELPEPMHQRVVRAGIAEPRVRVETVTLGGLIERFLAAAVVKDSTRAAYGQTIRSLLEHFGQDMPVTALTPADADAWRKALTEAGDGEKALAPATVAKRVRVAKSILRKAVRWGVIPSSPFSDLRAGSQSNPERSFYVTRETVQRVLDACPDEQWRAIVALGRFAGLRCPSEIVGLRWGDVDWQRLRLTVRSPKTAGHGHAVRHVPIDPVHLRPILMNLFEQAEPGTDWVVSRLRDPSMNLRTTFTKVILRAGERPWPRLFHALRASCAIDWCDVVAGHAVADWLGHSEVVAAKHYLTTRDHHFAIITGIGPASAPAAQNPARHPSASGCTPSHDDSETPCFAGVLQPDATECEAVQDGGMGLVGLESSSDSSVISTASTVGGADSGAQSGDSGPATPPPQPPDPDLAVVVEAWPALPPAIRAGVMAMVRAAGDDK